MALPSIPLGLQASRAPLGSLQRFRGRSVHQKPLGLFTVSRFSASSSPTVKNAEQTSITPCLLGQSIQARLLTHPLITASGIQANSLQRSPTPRSNPLPFALKFITFDTADAPVTWPQSPPAEEATSTDATSLGSRVEGLPENRSPQSPVQRREAATTPASTSKPSSLEDLSEDSSPASIDAPQSPTPSLQSAIETDDTLNQDVTESENLVDSASTLFPDEIEPLTTAGNSIQRRSIELPLNEGDVETASDALRSSPPINDLLPFQALPSLDVQSESTADLPSLLPSPADDESTVPTVIPAPSVSPDALLWESPEAITTADTEARSPDLPESVTPSIAQPVELGEAVSNLVEPSPSITTDWESDEARLFQAAPLPERQPAAPVDAATDIDQMESPSADLSDAPLTSSIQTDAVDAISPASAVAAGPSTSLVDAPPTSLTPLADVDDIQANHDSLDSSDLSNESPESVTEAAALVDLPSAIPTEGPMPEDVEGSVAEPADSISPTASVPGLQPLITPAVDADSDRSDNPPLDFEIASAPDISPQTFEDVSPPTEATVSQVAQASTDAASVQEMADSTLAEMLIPHAESKSPGTQPPIQPQPDLTPELQPRPVEPVKNSEATAKDDFTEPTSATTQNRLPALPSSASPQTDPVTPQFARKTIRAKFTPLMKSLRFPLGSWESTADFVARSQKVTSDIPEETTPTLGTIPQVLWQISPDQPDNAATQTTQSSDSWSSVEELLAQTVQTRQREPWEDQFNLLDPQKKRDAIGKLDGLSEESEPTVQPEIQARLRTTFPDVSMDSEAISLETESIKLTTSEIASDSLSRGLSAGAKLDDETLEQLAHSLYREIREHLPLLRERQGIPNYYPHPWLTVFAQERLLSKQQVGTERMASANGSFTQSAAVIELIQMSLLLINQRLSCDRDRHGQP